MLTLGLVDASDNGRTEGSTVGIRKLEFDGVGLTSLVGILLNGINDFDAIEGLEDCVEDDICRNVDKLGTLGCELGGEVEGKPDDIDELGYCERNRYSYD